MLIGGLINLAEVRSLLRIRIARQLAAAPDPELTALYEEMPAPESEDASHPVESEVAIESYYPTDAESAAYFA
ncbi:hypothetical protein JYK22_16530, partial [Nonomuraea sp. RK-328]|nr:hypothetical protein [Nonomuraea sp. RK-328]